MSRRRGSGGRRWRHTHHRDRSAKRTTQQLVATIATLVMLIAFWDQLSGGAAGCFTSMTQSPKAIPTESAPPSEPSEKEPPTVRFQLPSE